MQMYQVVFFLFPENRSEIFLRENWHSLKKVRDNVVVNALPAPLLPLLLLLPCGSSHIFAREMHSQKREERGNKTTWAGREEEDLFFYPTDRPAPDRHG